MLKPALRERLLGALVFLCLGLIFYPVIFDTRDEFVIDRESQIPTQLVRVDSINLAEPEVPDAGARVPSAEAIFVPPETAIAQIDTPAGILNTDGVPNAWVLQAGSFADQANAVDLEQRLLADGYRAYIRRSEAADASPRYRVLVGPYLDRGIAQTDSAAMIQDEFNAPILLEFSP